MLPAIFKRWPLWQGINHPNWYIPAHLGGFGVDSKYAPEGYSVTRSQRLTAARFIYDPTLSLFQRKGAKIPTSAVAGALAKWKYVVGDYVQRDNEMFDDDPWLARIAYAARANRPSPIVSPLVMLITTLRKQAKEYRLKPASLQTIADYSSARMVSVNVPPCPPIGTLPIRVTPEEFHHIPMAYHNGLGASYPFKRIPEEAYYRMWGPN
jgi:hypothetical protein